MAETEDATTAEWIRSTVRRYEGPLVRYAYGLTRNLELARDVVQDTFLRLCRQDRERVEQYVGRWLYTVCRNRALEIMRKEKRMSLPGDEILDRCQAADPGPGEQTERSDLLRHVAGMVAALPHRQKEVIRLKFQDGLSYRDISEVTGLSVSNVGYLIHQGVKSLRQQVRTGAPALIERRADG
jgi:RNA polymerase sigma-70 factor (ECF subfamily)